MPCAVLRNDTKTDAAWLRLRLIGDQSNRDAVGAQIEVQTGGRLYYHQRKGGGSYLSANDPRVHIGHGKADRIDHLRIRWPNGARQEFHDCR